MPQTVEGIIDHDGKLRVSDQVQLPKSRRIIITILDEIPLDEEIDSALLSEPALAEDWNRPEEDEAWSHLPQLPSL